MDYGPRVCVGLFVDFAGAGPHPVLWGGVEALLLLLLLLLQRLVGHRPGWIEDSAVGGWVDGWVSRWMGGWVGR